MAGDEGCFWTSPTCSFYGRELFLSHLSLSPVFVVVAVVFLGSGLLHYHSTHHLLSMLPASVELYLSGTKGT